MEVDVSSNPVFIVAFISIVIGTVVFSIIRQSQQPKQADRMSGFAASHGLQLISILGQGSLSGPWAGLDIKVSWCAEQDHDSDHSHTSYYTDIEAKPLKPLPQIRLTPEDIFAKAGQLIGMQDLKTGDESFDHRFAISARDNTAARRFLSDASVRRAIGTFKLESMDIGAASVVMRVNGHVKDLAVLQPMIDNVVAIARAADKF